MITDIATAVLTLYDSTPAGDDLRSVLTGGLWFVDAKDGVDFPYAVFTWDGSTIEEQAGGTQSAKQTSRIETASLTFSIFSKNDDGGAEIFNITEEFIALFDWADLTYPMGSTLTHLIMRRNSIINRGIVDKIWAIDMNYDIMFEH